LFDIDVPWIADGLRDLGEQRESMMKIFRKELTKRNIQPILVNGNWNDREMIIKKEIDKLLK
jgi:nicotinamide riboside kinase